MNRVVKLAFWLVHVGKNFYNLVQGRYINFRGWGLVVHTRRERLIAIDINSLPGCQIYRRIENSRTAIRKASRFG